MYLYVAILGVCLCRKMHTVERCWPERNARVNYSIKLCLIKMEEIAVIDMDSPVHKFCVSWFTLRVANAGTFLGVKSWNDHCIPGVVHINILKYHNIMVLLLQERGFQTDWLERRTSLASSGLVIYPLLKMLFSSFHQGGSQFLAHLALFLWRKIQA